MQAQRELTFRALVLGGILAVLLGAANAYLGLFAGMTVSACIPSAVISMGVLRLLGHAGIGENTLVMTQGSAGEALAAAAIFTLPALVLLGVWDHFPYLWVTAIAGIGGVLGVLLTIPLRRALIVEQDLKFPEGTAVAEVLRVGERAGQGLRALAGAGLLGALIKFAETGLQLWPGTAQAAGFVGRGIAYFGTNLSPALLGIGYIVGLNIAALVFAGSMISWNLAIPVYAAWFLPADPAFTGAAGLPAADLAYLIWTKKIRYLGVGAMLVGGLWALVAIRHSLLSGVRSGLAQFRRSRGQAVDPRDRDLPMPWVLAGIAACVLPIFGLYGQIVGHYGVAAAMAVTMLVAGFLFSSVAAYMAGLVGSSNNPISGVTMATMLLASLLLLVLLGPDNAQGPAAAIMIGAVVCCAASLGGDLLQDLKTGQLVGATPWKQQLALAAGVLVAVFVMAPILNLLLQAYGIGEPSAAHPKPLVAPQATLMASVAQGVFRGGLPWGMVAAGAGIGLAVILLDEWLRRRGASVRAPVLAVAVGIYLPLEVDTPIFVGGLIAWLVQRRLRRADSGAGAGTLFAAGLITGEALVGILLAIPIVITGSTELLAVPAAWRPGALAGLAAVALVAALLYRAGMRSSA
ncbi:MAG: oligopeptide transporter, OPT family protein [Gammaproteobacteria bacterium]|nr:MAG: oligopeptide transporter, OPT family [Pseudomonadota bacterium]MCE7895415.1 oligopeptide transporter, OPT family [Gammaproteobacteria bacterium PRO8]MCL4776933.1 oligopeptide transporter, OPT family [Gammaproteobacteria bacterium]MDL1879812.1 oligopeptide transporter, OPT family [Gammaproteobacteria bacterium PRO2]MCQ3933814.1 oligopeptide transporter, OPT family [Gammaproteobacteria bacterium]